MGRPNWYSDHPPACTCVACEARRTGGRRKGGIVTTLGRWLRGLLGGRR